MTIDLKIPTGWKDLTTEQLREVVELALMGLHREEYLLVLFCKFANVKIMIGDGPSTGSGTGPSTGSGTAPSTGSGTGPSTGSGTAPSTGSGTAPSTGSGTAPSTGSGTVKNRFRDSEGQEFELEDWQVAEFCGRLAFVLDEQMPMEVAWPFKWDRYLLDTSFGDWFHADAMMLRFAMNGDEKYIEKAMKDLGDPHPNLKDNGPDMVLMLRWYDLFKGWLQERYPLVFQKADSSTGSESVGGPIEARQNIMLMLNEGHPQDNEAIEKTNVHDVLAALQHKVEEAKHIEEQMSKYKN